MFFSAFHGLLGWLRHCCVMTFMVDWAVIAVEQPVQLTGLSLQFDDLRG